jgi:serine/threonine-protein kinase HipA
MGGRMVKDGPVSSLNVLMNGILVAKLEKTKTAGLIFRYAENWLKTPGARPISLSLPLTNAQFEGEVVYNFFDNLLPDNALIKSRIQSKFKAATDRPYDLLFHIGKDCVGALQLLEDDKTDFKHQILSHPLKENEIATLLRNVKINPLGMNNDFDDFRISIAGAQEKTAFLFWENNWRRPIGATPTTHIFKLPIGFLVHQQMDLSESCENEWLCLKISAAFGLPTAQCQIQYFEDVKVLIVERFDRKLAEDGHWIMRLPQEDICQALGLSPNLKYQNDGGPGIDAIMRLLLASSVSKADRDQFFRSQVLFWLLAAIDGHAKNFSIFIEPFGSYRLTPLYDIISAYPLMFKKQLQTQKVKMAMALRGKSNHYHWAEMQRRYFLQTAKHANYSIEKAENILDEMLEKVEPVIQQVSQILPPNFPSDISQAIFSGMLSAKNKLKKI